MKLCILLLKIGDRIWTYILICQKNFHLSNLMEEVIALFQKFGGFYCTMENVLDSDGIYYQTCALYAQQYADEWSYPSMLFMTCWYCRFSAQEDEDEGRPNLLRRTTIGNGWSLFLLYADYSLIFFAYIIGYGASNRSSRVNPWLDTRIGLRIKPGQQ